MTWGQVKYSSRINTSITLISSIGRMFLVMKIVSAVFALGMSILFGWIIRKLSSSGIRTEFGR